jgi:hypothetical protein
MFKTPEDRLSEIQLYELVAEELDQSKQSKGLWAKALADGEGNIEKAKGLYIKLRVEMIRDEWAYAEKVANERQKQSEERKKEKVQTTEWRSSAEAKLLTKKEKIIANVFLIFLLIGAIWSFWT